MNYLAHLVLSGNDTEILTGNLMGDFLTRSQLAGKSEKFRIGYDLHMFIDRYTDADKQVDEVIDLFRQKHGKYATVITDIIFDYFLCVNWQRFYSIDFDEYMNGVYVQIDSQLHLLPEKVSRLLRRMISGNFIEKYRTLHGLEFIMDKMDQRASFPAGFVHSLTLVKENEDYINERFLEFYTRLKSATEQQLIILQSETKL